MKNSDLNEKSGLFWSFFIIYKNEWKKLIIKETEISY